MNSMKKKAYIYYKEHGFCKTLRRACAVAGDMLGRRAKEWAESCALRTSWLKRRAGKAPDKAVSEEAFLSRCADILVGKEKFERAEEILPAATMLCGIFRRAPALARTQCLNDSLEWVEKIGNMIVQGVNPDRAVSQDRSEIRKRLETTLYFKNIRHLELGTYKAFPDDRVLALKKERGIGEFIRLDIDPTYNPDVVADCTKLPFTDESIDSISSNSLFEHVADPHEIITESFRVLSPGGVMQVTMPFHFVQHFCPKDYVRLTPQWFEDTCKRAGFEEVYTHVNDFGGLYYTMHQASKAATIDPAVPDELYRVAHILHRNVIALLALSTVFDRYFIGGARQFYVSVYCVAFKDGQLRPREPVSTDKPTVIRLLPYLACPECLQSLCIDEQGNLKTKDGTHGYAIRKGIPFLLPTWRTGTCQTRDWGAQHNVES